MYKLKSLLLAEEPGQSGDGSTTTNPPSASSAFGAPGADVQAQIDAGIQAAVAKHQVDFSAEFEKATGHKDLKAFNEARLKQEGKLQELADSKAAEATTYKGRYESLAISNELLRAASEAVDPSTVVELLQGKAVVDDAGKVTVDGKPVADAVKALLEAKPFLARAQGGPGSGAPANADAAVKQIVRAEFERMAPPQQIQFVKDGGQVV